MIGTIDLSTSRGSPSSSGVFNFALAISGPCAIYRNQSTNRAMTSAISWVAEQVREAVGVVHEGTGLGTCWCTGCSPTLASRSFQQMFSQDYDIICQVEIVRSHSLTDNHYKVFATANTMIDAADCDTTFCTLKFPCFFSYFPTLYNDDPRNQSCV